MVKKKKETFPLSASLLVWVWTITIVLLSLGALVWSAKWSWRVLFG